MGEDRIIQNINQIFIINKNIVYIKVSNICCHNCCINIQGKYTFSMIRVSATTHTVNTDQRRIPLDGQDGGDGKSFSVNMPSDYGVVIPGYYMMFAMNEAGTPCVAKFFKVSL